MRPCRPGATSAAHNRGKAHQAATPRTRRGLVDIDELAPGRRRLRPDSYPCSSDHAILLLQCEADPLSREIRNNRAEDQQGLQRVDHTLHGELEVRRHQVRACARPHDRVEGDAGSTDAGAGRRITRTVEQVVLALVASDPGFDEGIDRDKHDEDTDDAERDQHVPRPRVPEPLSFEPGRYQPEHAVGRSLYTSQHVEPADDVSSGKLAAEEEVTTGTSPNGDRLDDAVIIPKAVA
ncbi:hypothetical protein FQA39_LY19384 [Lamprigera yunnana]|nr:hypothetical protein FQA39_LY19384 [Lamprigera yunnana]